MYVFLLLLQSFFAPGGGSSFVPSSSGSHRRGDTIHHVVVPSRVAHEVFVGRQHRLRSSSSSRLRMGYQFGDLSKSLGKKLSEAVQDTTGQDAPYEFGDLSRWLDRQAKAKINEITDRDAYEFGDLSRWVDGKVKDRANAFTGKEDGDYEFGDLTKEIVRKATSGEYTFDDVLTLLKALLSFGVGLSPVAGLLPVTFLVNMLHYSILEDVGGRVVGALAQELDRRVKQAVTGDAQYELGDLTKREILKFVGKDEYEFGDITRTILNDATQEEEGDNNVGADTDTKPSQQLQLSPQILTELEEWDKAVIDVEVSK